MLRCPNIAFGMGERHEQVLELLREMSPATASELSEAYQERYGVDAALVAGIYLNLESKQIHHYI